MLIYDYRCDECGITYDIFHKVREVTEDILCPECGSPKHTRLISAPVIRKGKGLAFDAREAPPCAGEAGCDGSCGLN